MAVSKVEQVVYAVMALGIVVVIMLPLIPPLPPPLGGAPCTPGPLPPDIEVTGTLSPGGCRISDVLSGVTENVPGVSYRLALSQRSLVTIDMRSTEFDSLLMLLDAQRSPIATDDDSGGGRNARIVRPLEPGSYVILARAQGSGRGRYTLRAGVQTADCPVRPLTLPATVTGRLTTGICPAVTLQGARAENVQAEQYRFSVSQRGAVLIELESRDFDSLLHLLNAGYVPLARDDDSGGGRNSRIIREVEPGDYIVLAGSLGQGTGAYTLRVSFSPSASGGGATAGSRNCPLVDLALNRTVTGRLGSSNCRVRDLVPGQSDAAFADQYRITLTSPGTLTINMRSDELDSYLILLDSSRNSLARDDDGGEGRNSRITYPLGPGAYIIVANSYGGVAQGAYTLQATLSP